MNITDALVDIASEGRDGVRVGDVQARGEVYVQSVRALVDLGLVHFVDIPYIFGERIVASTERGYYIGNRLYSSKRRAA